MNSTINIPEYGVSQFNKAIKDIIEIISVMFESK